MASAVIIGAGIVGASVAYRLSQAGVEVTVLEAVRPAAGTSSNSFAWVNANDKPPRPYHDLNAGGVAEHHRLAEELPNSGFTPSGHLEWVTSERARAYLQEKIARLGEWGYRAEAIERDRAAALALDLALPPADSADYAFYSEEGWVVVPVLIHRLLEAATRTGARAIYPAPVEGLLLAGDTVAGVRAGGTEYRADTVIDCTGRDAGSVLEASLPLRIDRKPSPGLLAISEPLPSCFERVLHTPDVNLRPDGGGRLRIAADDLDERLGEALAAGATLTEDSSICREYGDELLRRARAVLPALNDARLETLRLGWRALPGDEFSAVGPVPGAPNYYVVFTHSAVTMGPFLGRLVADEIVTGEPAPELATFRPDRLVSRVER